MFQLLLLLAGCGLVAAAFFGHDRSQSDGKEARRGRQEGEVQGGGSARVATKVDWQPQEEE